MAVSIYHGLYLINPDTGAVRPLTTRGRWSTIGPLAAWGYDYADQSRPDTPHTLLRYDIASGKIAAFFTTPGSAPSVIGFDEQDHPIVSTTNDVAQQVWMLMAANQADQIYSGPGFQSTDRLNFTRQAVTDEHGMWVGTNRGLMLLTSIDGFKKVSDTTGQVAGSCH